MRLLVTGLVLILMGCKQVVKPPPLELKMAKAVDVHSFATEEALVTHVSLNLEADFEEHVLKGTALLSINKSADAKHLVLDTLDLEIEKVLDQEGHELSFSLENPHEIFGQALKIELLPKTNKVMVHYQTSPTAQGLQWLSPAQTAGKKHPYLFSQGEAILTRTWIPLQDSPSVRVSYDAKITVPDSLRALMSAEDLTPEGEKNGKTKVFSFSLKEKIPSYLIALAVGDLAYQELGPRTGVYTEPAMLKEAAHDFADTEKMVEAVEEMFGPYRWGRFDILLLPPSFPFGGMENPRLTFISPTVLTGDRSLNYIIAHELAHSWSGNLVTNATWSDFWLNEGVTTYIERRIIEKLYGRDLYEMQVAMGRDQLLQELEEVGPDSWLARLYAECPDKDPDEAMTGIPYEKGSLFLRTLENAVGRETFDIFIRNYFDAHAFGNMSTKQFLSLVRQDLLHGDKALADSLELDTWVYKGGVPSSAIKEQASAFVRVESEVRGFLDHGNLEPLHKYGTMEWVYFLRQLPRNLVSEQMKRMDDAFKLSEIRNAEIRFEWLRLGIATAHEPARRSVAAFLTSQGRRKFVKPLYEDLLKSEWVTLAKDIFKEAKPMYHSMTNMTVDALFDKGQQ